MNTRVSASNVVLTLAVLALALVVGAAWMLPISASRAPHPRDAAPLALFPAAANLSGQTSGMLPRDKLTLGSALAVDLTHDLVVLPLHEGRYRGSPVWYVITDVSNARLARALGVNFAPRLANVGVGCPGCVQEVSAAPSEPLGSAPVTFAGAPDFRPTRSLAPGSESYPPAVFQPGALGGPGYSPFVRIRGASAVYDAPIVATGAGPFDVVHHTNTHDRALAIDTRAMTVSLLLARGYACGQPIIFLSFESSDALTATLDRDTFVPALSAAPYPNGSIPLIADLEQNQFVSGVHLSPPRPPTTPTPDAARSARMATFSFTDGAGGSTSQPGQGWTHLLSSGHDAQDASLGATSLLAALRSGGDSHDVLSFFPTLKSARLAQQYSPLGDVMLTAWSRVAVAHGLNTVRTDAIETEELAADGIVTSPGGSPLSASGVVVNAPALGFTGVAPRLP